MDLPFTTEQFLQVFSEYNKAAFPFQAFLFFLAAIVIYLSVTKKTNVDKIVNSILAFLWLWMGLIYHIVFFAAINKAAYAFGAAFVIQAGLFFNYGVVRRKLAYRFTWNMPGLAGLVIAIFALVLYPLLGYSFGHVYPAAPTFGAPCPATIFTFGVLLWADRDFPKIMLVIPFLWSLVGFSAATMLGMTEDISLLVASVLVTSIVVLRKQNHLEPSQGRLC